MHKPAIKKTRDKRQQESLRWLKAVPSHAYLQVMGTDRGSPNGIYLFTDHRSYLFNCGEGFQRMAQEHKIKLIKFEHIFVTHNSWKNIGGLPGFTLTVQDMGLPKMNLHGPPEVEDVYKMTKGFVKAKYVEIEKHEYDQETYQDGSLKVTYVPLCVPKSVPSGTDAYSMESRPGSSSDENEPFSEPPEMKVFNAKRIKLDPELQRAKDISLAYICKLHNKPGELKIQRCMELGVPVGPLLGCLKNGENVTLENGDIVYSKDVVYPEEPGATFIVIECPREDFIDPLLNAKLFNKHQNSASEANDIAEVVVHFTPQSVIQHPQYLEWIKRFPPETTHLFVNELCSGLCSSAVSQIQHKLHLVNSEIFPILECEAESRQELWKNVRLDIPSAVFAEPLLLYHLRPMYRVDKGHLVVTKTEEYRKEVLEDARCVEKLTELQQKIDGLPITDDGHYPEVTFLGTGSSIPNKSRNVSGIIVQTSPDTYMILDCGEGTIDQMVRLFGSDTADHILRNLRAVFISHIHADHHMGLIKILLEHGKLRQSEGSVNPVYIIAPPLISSWLEAYSQKFQQLKFYRWISSALLSVTSNSMTTQLQNLLSRLRVREVKTVEVLHCRNAYGIVLTDECGKKLVYSGDTMPCESLIKAGNQCHVLIHEATMEDNLVLLARSKMHSTTSEAIEVSEKMKATYTVLTHFSQRYSKIPLFNENFNPSIGIAFDNMKIRWCDFPRLSAFIPVLKEIFSEDYDLLIDKKEKRNKQPMDAE